MLRVSSSCIGLVAELLDGKVRDYQFSTTTRPLEWLHDTSYCWRRTSVGSTLLSIEGRGGVRATGTDEIT